MKESTIKKCWLGATLLYLAWGLLACFTLAYLQSITLDPVAQEQLIWVIGQRGLGVLLSLVWAFLLYVFAYKRPGTLLLTTTMTLVGFSILYILFTLATAPAPIEGWLQSLLFTDAILLALWSYFSSHLRMVNSISRVQSKH